MNIFELILSDPASYQQVSHDFATQSSSWAQFKQNLLALFSSQSPDIDPLINRSKEMWARTLKASP